ncbi:hypothetical protein ACEPAF_1163 [Sanghuangporus sanghuang]
MTDWTAANWLWSFSVQKTFMGQNWASTFNEFLIHNIPPHPTLPPHETFKPTLRKRHLEQLRHIQIPAERLPESPWPAPRRAPAPYEQLVQWSEQATTQIAKALQARLLARKYQNTIDWNVKKLTLLESAADDLRDTDKVFRAVIEAQKNTRKADEHAIQLLEGSQAEIKKLAALWGLDFEVICGNILWGSPIHNGFYHTMFTEFPDIGQAPLGTSQPLVRRSGCLLYEVPEGITINLHSIGHSLVAAYAMLCHAELMRLYNNAPTDPEFKDDPHADLAHFFSHLKARQFVLCDLYTFGSPRIGGLIDNVSWEKSYKTALDNHSGQSWRIQNNFDPVTAVPPVIPLISTWNPVDNGYQINDSAPPQALPTETDTQPCVGLHPENFPNHSTAAYFQNIYTASTTGPKIKVDLIQQLLDEAGSAPTKS